MKIIIPILGTAIIQSDKYSAHQNATYCYTAAPANVSLSHTIYTPPFVELNGPILCL
jgi:hypothetical protein